MEMTMRHLPFLAILALFGTASGALAQTVDARCAKMKDPVGCTCALIYGGTVSNGTWARARGSDAPSFNTCLAERGGKAPARPTTIPGRL
jgi:hypothetical protein